VSILDFDFPSIPFPSIGGDAPGISLPNVTPQPITDMTGFGNTPLLPYNPQLPSYRTQFINKYNELDETFQTLPPEAQQALLNYDAGRVQRGSPPLTREQTIGAIQTILSNNPATPPPARDPSSIWSNITGDITAIVKSIPRLPAAIVGEVRDLSNFGQYMAESGGGAAAFFGAPGVRLLPGSYIAENLAQGTEGIRTLATTPVMTALDILPYADAALGALNPAARTAGAQARAAGLPTRNLRTALTRTVDSTGAVTPNRLGQLTRSFLTETSPGQKLLMFGRESRDTVFGLNLATGRVRAVGQGTIAPTTPIETALREATVSLDKYAFDDAAAADFFQRLETDEWRTATPEQLAAKSEYTSILNRISQEENSLGVLSTIVNPRNPGVTEFVTPEVARRVQSTQRMADHASRMVQRRARLFAPDPARTLDTIYDDAAAVVRQRGNMSSKQIRVELRGIQHELDAMGYDASAIRGALNAWGKKGYDPINGFMRELDRLVSSTPSPTTRYNVSDLLDILQREAANGNIRADRLAQRLAAVSRDLTKPRIAGLVRDLIRAHESKSGRYFIAELDTDPAFLDSLRSLNERFKWTNDMIDNEKVAQYTPRLAQQSRRLADRELRKAIPARFIPEVERQTLKTLGEFVTATHKLSPDEAARVADDIMHRNWSSLPGYTPKATEQLIGDIGRDIAKTWTDMQEAGFNPTFVHRLDPKRLRNAFKPTLTSVPNKVTHLKDRILNNPQPYEQNAFVALSHQASETITRVAHEEWIDAWVRTKGIKQGDLRAMNRQAATDWLAKNPGKTLDQAYDLLMRKTHSPFDPEAAGYSWASERLKTLKEDQLWIPKHIADTLKSLNDPKTVLGGVFDPVTQVFRHAVISLSPRNVLYNIVGGAVATGVEVGPIDLARNLGKARSWVDNPQLMLQDPRVSDALRAIMGSERELFDTLDYETAVRRANDIRKFKLGLTTGRLWQESRAVNATKAGFNKATGWSMDINTAWDDTYKIVGYLSGYDKALRKGLSPKQAEAAGLELLRKVMPDYASMVPVERAVLRSIMPFYSFMSFALRFVFRYPMDHPIRAAVIAAFARAELEDMDTLPGSFLSNIFITDMNDNGRSTALNLAAFNPFGDAGDMMTFAGFLSATNPVIQTILESVGVQRGESELYPTLRFDPDTGRLAAVHPNPLLAFVNNTIPQTQIATALLGVNTDFNERLRADPWSAYRTLIAAGGLPILWRGINVPVEQAKAEVARQRSANAVLSNAQKSGNWTDALRYPSLQAFYEQQQTVTPEMAMAYQPRPGEADLLIEAYRSGMGAASFPTSPGLPPPAGSLRGLVAGTGGV
jgi:hypothetical protein